jgi:hypothetical protein
MSVVYVIVTVVTAAANIYAAVTDILRPKWLLDNMAEVGVPRPWLPLLAFLKDAGAAGLLLGLVGFGATGTAGAAGLVVFFIGAMSAHIRKSVFHNIAFPGGYLALALASLALALEHRRTANARVVSAPLARSEETSVGSALSGSV